MIHQSLAGAWQMRELKTQEWLPAVVPGEIYVDLLAAEKIPDPFLEMNENQVQWVADRDWEYQREFQVDETLLNEDRVELVCLGLDTLAEVTLNGQMIGKTNNMFRTYRWDVKELLKAGQNSLSIILRSPTGYIQSRQEERKLPAMMNAGVAHIRKVQSHFGWDWGPTLPTSGIWREIRLEGSSTAKLSEIHLRQNHKDGAVTLSAATTVDNYGDAELELQMTLTAPDGTTQQTSLAVENASESTTLMMAVDNPQLWWPNGLGAQPLYQVKVTLLANGKTLDEQTYQVGLRQLELRQEADEWGKNFQFVVNDVPIFVRGGDWIPADSLPTRMTPERYDSLIHDAATANMNMLRIWGGGYYEDEHFYDACDRYGILIWQDFMFACAAYPLDEPDFLENVRVEVEETVQRLRHRACLALWCGNNEMEMMWGMWKRHRSLTQAFEQFFYHQLPAWVETLDPDRTYWPSSPSSGKFMEKTNSDAYGDTHLWQVWHGLKPFTYFRKRFTRVASEFGLESLPTLQTFREYTDEKDLRIDSKVVLHHQRSVGGNDKIMFYLTDRFRVPQDFSDVIYLSQILQAEAMRIGFEHWRRNSPRCNGALYWQYNDCWPVTSWASVDYHGRWKALQYTAKRFNAPLALSLKDSGSHIRAFVVNEAQKGWQGTLRWTLETLNGEIIESGSEEVSIDPVGVVALKAHDFSAAIQTHGKTQLMYTASLFAGDERIAWQTAAFAVEKKINFPEPDLNWTLTEQNGTVEINLTSKAFARFVWLEAKGADTVFSDNFFDLPANWTTTITCDLPAGWTIEQFEQALRVRSLADVEPAGSPFSDKLLHIYTGLKPVSLFTRILFSFID